MLEILLSNYLVWLNLLIPFGVGLYLFLTNKEYVLKEFLLQVGITIVVIVGTFALCFRFGTDMYSSHYENAYITKFVYEEEWTELVHYTEERCSGSGKSKRCVNIPKTRYNHHPDKYYSLDSIGNSFNISKDNWNAYKKFGSKQVHYSHIGQSSYGDGRTFEGSPNEIIPTVVERSSINYVYASKSNIIKSDRYTDLEKRYAKELKPYPTLVINQYGHTEISRVINPTLIGEAEYIKADKILKETASQLGATKKVNPLIYFTTAPREFAYVVKGLYASNHNNDCILVVGLDSNGRAIWSESASWTKSSEFIVKARDLYKAGTPTNIATSLGALIKTNYTPIKMQEMAYLADEIQLDWKIQLLIVILNLVVSFFAFRFFIKN